MLLSLEATLSLLVFLAFLVLLFPLVAPIPDVIPIVRLYDESTVAMELGAFDRWCVGRETFSGKMCVKRYYFCPDGRLYEVNYCTG